MAHDIPSYALSVSISLEDAGENIQVNGDVDLDFDEFADVLTDEAAMRVFEVVETGDIDWGDEVQVEFSIEATNVLQPL